MQIEKQISNLIYLTPDQRASLRVHVAGCILGQPKNLPEHGPNWIDVQDYAVIRRAAIQEAYTRRVSGQEWIAGKDKAFHESQGVVRANSVLRTHKFLL